MRSQPDALAHLEAAALTELQQVDLQTPMQQMRQALEALLDVPTTARAANAPFSQQAEAALVGLTEDARQLCEVAQTLMTHVNRVSTVSRTRLEWHYLLSTVGEQSAI